MVGTTGGKVMVLSSDNLTKLGQLKDKQVDRYKIIILFLTYFSFIKC